MRRSCGGDGSRRVSPTRERGQQAPSLARRANRRPLLLDLRRGRREAGAGGLRAAGLGRGVLRLLVLVHQRQRVESFLEPGQVYELTVDLWSTSLVFNRGHRIRVAVSSSNSPRFEANPNTGKPFRADKETRVAKNTLHLSSKYPSRIVLPVHQATTDP